MKLNADTVLVGERTILVPYRHEHVDTYHGWMQDPDLLDATGSEPLTVAEEYAMQQTWRDDETKCTFILLARDLLRSGQVEALDRVMMQQWMQTTSLTNSIDEKLIDSQSQLDFIQNTLHAMVGDVNLFLSDEEEEEDDDEEREEGTANDVHAATERKYLQAELDIMIGEKEFRSKGVGREACILMMLFGVENFPIRRYFCKIKEDNTASLSLFQNKLGFVQCSYAECFREVELELRKENESDLMATLTSLLPTESVSGRAFELKRLLCGAESTTFTSQR
jgi:RimJ/RimL family protein N-acetyltransferase